MGRQREPQPYRSSSTRAIAWGALFFSFLSFLISLATFAVTWRDGQLVRNLQLSSQAIHDSVKTFREGMAPAGEPASEPATEPDSVAKPTRRVVATTATPAAPGEPAAPIPWDKVRERVGRVETMIRQGDVRAKYYLENLRHDLEVWRAVSPAIDAGWLAQASEAIKSARTQLSENAPDAARRLRTLAGELGEKLRGGSTEIAAPNPQAAPVPQNTPEPNEP